MKRMKKLSEMPLCKNLKIATPHSISTNGTNNSILNWLYSKTVRSITSSRTLRKLMVTVYVPQLNKRFLLPSLITTSGISRSLLSNMKDSFVRIDIINSEVLNMITSSRCVTPKPIWTDRSKRRMSTTLFLSTVDTEI